MRKNLISVTEAARNFADCVNRAHYQNATFVLMRNGSPVAQLVPADEKVCPGSALADVLHQVKLTSSELKSWRRDLRAAHKALKAPAERWR